MSEPKLTWHHPLCEGECFACLIERTIKKEYGEVGLRYLLKHINAAPVQQAEQEPVATVKTLSMEDGVAPFHYIECNHLPEGTKLYAAPVRTVDLTDDEILYAAPVRTKDLTDDEIDKIHSLDKFWDAHADDIFRYIDFARAVIAADREKNK